MLLSLNLWIPFEELFLLGLVNFESGSVWEITIFLTESSFMHVSSCMLGSVSNWF
jgi:hypothetical protein